MAARKSKKEKATNKTPEVIQVDEQLKEKELIPGKPFYESHWLRIQDKEDVDCFISSLIDEVFNSAFIQGHHKLCTSISLPYSVKWAKERIVEVIECYFIQHDNGQSVMVSNEWNEDEDNDELPAPIDSWARGIMPIETNTTLTSSTNVLMSNNDGEEVVNSTSTETSPDISITSVTPDTTTGITLIIERKESTSPRQSPRQFKKRASRPIAAGRKRDKQVMKVIDTIPEQVVISDPQLNSNSHTSTLQSHTPPTPSLLLSIPPIIDTPYDAIPFPTNKRGDLVTGKDGTIKYSRKLDTKKFPSPCIKPQVRVPMSQRTEMSHHQKVPVVNNGHNNKTSDNIHTRHHMRWTSGTTLPLHPATTKATTTTKTINEKERGGLQRVDSSRFPRKPVLPFIVDLMDPVPGVTVTAQGRSLSTAPEHVRINNKLRRAASDLKPIKPQKILGGERKDISKTNSVIIRENKVKV